MGQHIWLRKPKLGRVQDILLHFAGALSNGAAPRAARAFSIYVLERRGQGGRGYDRPATLWTPKSRVLICKNTQNYLDFFAKHLEWTNGMFAIRANPTVTWDDMPPWNMVHDLLKDQGLHHAAWELACANMDEVPKLEQADIEHHYRMWARACVALRNTWVAIAGDVLEAIALEQGGSPGIIRASGVREAVSACGFVGGHPATYGGDNEAVAWLDKQMPHTQDRVLWHAFPHEYYE